MHSGRIHGGGRVYGRAMLPPGSAYFRSADAGRTGMAVEGVPVWGAPFDCDELDHQPVYAQSARGRTGAVSHANGLLSAFGLHRYGAPPDTGCHGVCRPGWFPDQTEPVDLGPLVL